MKNMFSPQENKMVPSNMMNMYQPQPSQMFPFGQPPYMDYNQFLLQQDKMGQKIPYPPPNMNNMPGFPTMPPQRMDNYFEPQVQGGMGDSNIMPGNYMNLRNSFNEMAKRKDAKSKQYPNSNNDGKNN